MIEQVVENYKAADIPLESIWTDFDMFDGYRSFINNPVTYPVDAMAKWVDTLHENNQLANSLPYMKKFVPSRNFRRT
jgi:alpha-glucosidase